MIDPHPNVTPRKVRHFGVMLILFGAALGGLLLWRGDALIGAAMFLGGAWLISFILNGENRFRQLLGVILPVLCAGIGLPVQHGADPLTVAVVVWIVVGGIGLGAVVAPPFGRIVYVGWVLAAVPVSWTIFHLVLGIVYYLVLTPIGLILRFCRYDPMHRRFLPEAETYWIRQQPKTDSNRYFQQY